MLNGRVYGSKHDPNANPFANARDEEPSFVEWGYGGMGSVKGAKSAGVAGAGWEKLGGAVDDDLEDATGMAWIKKRREEKARKLAEEEAKAKAEEEAAKAKEEEKEETTANEEKASGEATTEGEAAEAKADARPPLSAASTFATITESAHPTPKASVADLAHHRRTASLASIRRDPPSAPSTPRIPPGTPARDISSPLSSAGLAAEEEHEIKTMNIPMSRPLNRHRSASNVTSPRAIEADKEHMKVDKPESESESESEETSSSDSDPEEDDDDDEEDEEELTGKMVLGAGMEKVSWHRTEVEGN